MKRILISLLCLLTSTTMAHAQVPRAVPEDIGQITLSFSSVAKKASPAVVNIYTTKKVVTQPFLNDPFFRQFFGNNPLFNGARQRVENSLGSGVIIRGNGLIITNYHVIKDSDAIKVVLSDSREFDAKIAVKEERTDLALLRIDTKGEQLPMLSIADSDQLEVGDLVLAVGNPFGVGQTVTHGIVSALGRTTVSISDYHSFIQTDAPINPGNSGGALVNMQGQLVGVNTAIFTRSGGSNGIGFAIPSNMVTAIIAGEAAGGKILRPWFGATSQKVTSAIADVVGLSRPEGVIIQKIHPNGPAAQAGLKESDIILTMDGHALQNDNDLRFRVATYTVGKQAKLTIWRNKNQQEITVLMTAPPETPPRDVRHLQGNQPMAGATIANLSPALAYEMGEENLTSGVIILSVDPGTFAQRFGLRKGDIAEQFGKQKIESTRMLEKLLLNEKSNQWIIQFNRDGKPLTLRVTP